MNGGHEYKKKNADGNTELFAFTEASFMNIRLRQGKVEMMGRGRCLVHGRLV